MLNLIMHSDIGSKAVQDALRLELSRNKRHLFLTSTAVLKAIRSKTVCAESKEQLFTFAEFEKSLTPIIFKNKDCLSNTEQKYLLSLIMKDMFGNDTHSFNAFNSICKELYKLFSSMQFSETKITNQTISKISQDYSIAESNIFELYRRYTIIIDDIIAISNGQTPSGELQGVLEVLPISVEKPLFTYQDKKKIAIRESINAIDTLFIDGFLFIDEIQKYTIKCAIETGKEVFIISKQFSDGSGAFIVEDVIKNLANEIGCKVNVALSGKESKNDSTALGFAKKTYPNIFGNNQAPTTLNDGSIRFIKPFINRDSELRFVVKNISDRIRENYDGELGSITSMLSDMAIIAAVNKEKYEQRISDLFNEVGAFILKENIPKNIANDTLLKVCFNKDEFLASEVKDNFGSVLSLVEKLKLFERCYHKIEINKHKRPISTYPIGQFVLRIYEIATAGMSLEAFKCIMFSNWRYNLNVSNQKWSDFIGDFKLLEVWFENKRNIADWKTTAIKLLELQGQIVDNPLYSYHPLNTVSKESLLVLKELISELEAIVTKINETTGRISDHIAVLHNVVMNKGNFELTEDSDQEQKIAQRLIDTVTTLKDNTLIGEVSSSYFADNIRAMLVEYEEETLDDNSPLSIAVVNLENMRSYKTAYFIMCEAGKYPRPYIEQFPYTKDLCDILSKKEYGINALPANRFGLQYHLNLERYLLKNVLDFVTDELIVTHTENEAGAGNSISLFAKSIAALFGQEVSFESSGSKTDETVVVGESQIIPEQLDKKENYSVTELAIFKLCPRMYYHRQKENSSCFTSRLQLHFYAEAIMYCDLLRSFIDYNLENKAVYNADDNQYISILEKLHKECVERNKVFFDFLSDYELSDTSRNVLSKVLSSIENSKQYIKGRTFTLIDYKDAVYAGNGYTVTVEHDNRFVDYETKSWRMSQSKSYLEFLVMKTDDHKSSLVHYKDMIEALDRNDTNEDRINLTSRILAKINIQFDSKKFAADGIKRTDDLVNEIINYNFAQSVAMPSNYCTYCRYNDVCLGK